MVTNSFLSKCAFKYPITRVSSIALSIRYTRKTENNEHVDIEIQVADKKDMVNRSLFYLCKRYTEQMKEGMKYKDLGKTIALNFLCFNLFEDEERHFVELKKVKKQKYVSADDIVRFEYNQKLAFLT